MFVTENAVRACPLSIEALYHGKALHAREAAIELTEHNWWICRPFKASGNKGPHFWDEGGHDWGKYTELFSVVSDQVAKDEGPVDTVTVDASSNTFSVSGVSIRGQRYGPSGTLPDEVLLPDVLKATQPESKVVVMLRNPVTRCSPSTCEATLWTVDTVL